MSAYDYIYEKNKDHPQEIAFRYLGASYTYQELFERISRFAKALLAAGVSKGDMVTIVLPNLPEIILLFYACDRIGAVANLIDPRTNGEEIIRRINESESIISFVLFDIYADKVLPFEDRVKSEIVIVSPTESLDTSKLRSAKAVLAKALYGMKCNRKNCAGHRTLKEFIGATKLSELPAVDRDEYSVCCIVYTSGTSGGAAKGVMLSDKAFNNMHGMQMGGQKGYSRQDTFLGGVPFFTAYGAINGMHISLCNGWTILLIPKFHPNDFDLLIKKYRPNHALGVPRFWESIVDNGRLNHDDLSFLILPTCGGDKITPASAEKINRFFKEHGSSAKLVVGYGATEFGGAFSVTVADEALYAAGSAGFFMDGVIGRIFDPETGEELKGPECEGELYVHSPSMMLGYYKKDAETEAITWYDEDGRKYYKTGDKVRIDARGMNWVIDRYKRVIIRPDGHTVGASAIENVIAENKYVLGVAVAGIAIDKKAGAIPTAFIRLKNDIPASPEEVIKEIEKLCEERIPERDKALAFVIVEDLPYTKMGKVDYLTLEKKKFAEMQVFWVKDPLTKKL